MPFFRGVCGGTAAVLAAVLFLTGCTSAQLDQADVRLGHAERRMATIQTELAAVQDPTAQNAAGHAGGYVGAIEDIRDNLADARDELEAARQQAEQTGIVDTIAGYALPFIPPPYQQLVLLGLPIAGLIERWGKAKRSGKALDSLAKSTVNLANDNWHVRQAIENNRYKLANTQTPLAKKAIDKAQGKQ